MSYADNLIGKRFGKLLVISRNYDRQKELYEQRKGNKSYWNCLCDCGNIAIVGSSALKNKKSPTSSCGCYKKERIKRMVISDLKNIDNQYDLIYSDPPWKQSRGGKKSVRENSSGKALDYPTMSLDDIKEHLRLATEATEENAILFLWTIDRYLFEAQQIAENLGYKLHARMIWDKVTGIPAAFTVRYGHEYLLYMYRGKLIPVAKDERGKIHTVFREKVTKHSKKPEIAYEIIERLYPNLRKLEMYARNMRPDWDCFGNEVAD